MSFSKYREYFPITKTDTYLNHAAISPFSTRVTEAIEEYIFERSQGVIDLYKKGVAERDQLKTNITKLINGEHKFIAIVQNTSTGLNMLANGLKWQAGDRILLNDIEFPANVYPFLNLKRYGVEIDYVPNRDGKILVEDIKKYIKPKTKLLSISFVEFINGFRSDLVEIGKICQHYEIVFSVDGIQGVGGLPLDVKAAKIDFLANGVQKWMMGPQGLGFIYFSPELFKKLEPVFVGWLAVKDGWNFLDYNLDLLEDAGRYEISTANFLGIIGAKAATDLLVEVEPAKIEKHLFKLGDLLIESLPELGFRYIGSNIKKERSGIYSFTHSNIDENNFFAFLQKNRIHVSMRNGALRISPHFYNNESDIEHFINTCKNYFNS